MKTELDVALARWQEVCDDFDALLLNDLTVESFVERFTHGGESAIHRLAEASMKWAALTKAGPVRASKCVFPMVKEELLVYPTDERRSYGTPEDLDVSQMP